MDELTVPSFAKINLVLRVLGRRPDGYHELETIFQTISLHDTLRFRFRPSGSFGLSLEADSPEVPLDQRNLVYKSCLAFHERFPLRCSIEITLQKRIPVESGLGGGSSNAACTLLALSRYCGEPSDTQALVEIAGRLGADVPFFLHGGTALGTGRGDVVEQLSDTPPLPVLIVRPPVSCSTAEIYRKYDEAGLLTAPRNSIKILVRPESLSDLYSHIENDLEKVVFSLYPEFDSIKKRLLDTGAAAAALSGSGSALFGLFRTAEDIEKASHNFPESYQCRFVSRDEYGKAMSNEQ